MVFVNARFLLYRSLFISYIVEMELLRQLRQVISFLIPLRSIGI